MPCPLLKQLKRLAADRDTSVQAIVTEALSRLPDEELAILRREHRLRERSSPAGQRHRSLH